MKRFTLTGLCFAMSVLLSACSFGKDTKWIAEGTQMLEPDIQSSEIYINGIVYSFPSDMSDWINTGWHVSESYENKDEFELEPGIESTEFELFNEDDEYVTVTVLNMSDENAKIEECMVSSLRISMDPDLKVVLPKGITAGNKPAEVVEAYGEPDTKDEDNGSITAYYNYTTDDDDAWICQMELLMIDNDYTHRPLSAVEYTLSDDNWGGSKEDVRTYIDTALRTSFYGDYTEYVEKQYDTQENAVALYESEKQYYAECLMYYLDIDSGLLDETVVEEFCKVAEVVLRKAKWEIGDMLYDEMTLTGTMELLLYPVDFLDIINSDVDMVITEFQNKYSEVDFDNCTEEELAAMEQDYADMMLKVLKAKADETKVKECVTKSYDVNYEEGVISDDDWYEIDDTLMGFGE